MQTTLTSRVPIQADGRIELPVAYRQRFGAAGYVDIRLLGDAIVITRPATSIRSRPRRLYTARPRGYGGLARTDHVNLE